jgi:hypothetical protein
VGEHGGLGETVEHGRVVEADLDQLGDPRCGVPYDVGWRQGLDPGAADGDPAAQQPVAGDLLVQAQQRLADGLGVCLGDAVADVVGERAEVCDVVVQAFERRRRRWRGRRRCRR